MSKEQIESLITKAERAEKSEDALRFSQAALNAANALCSLGSVPKEK
jgi:hypothetical protein